LGIRLHGEDIPPPSKRYFDPISVTRQHHTTSLADFLVHLLAAAHQQQVRMVGFCRENTVRLTADDQSLFPDCAFQLVTPTGAQFNYFVELDNSTERVRSQKDVDHWERKIRLYDLVQDKYATRFRVIVVTTRSQVRVENILQTAAATYRNPDRTLLIGAYLKNFLAIKHAATTPCFLDHRRQYSPLVAMQPLPSKPLAVQPSPPKQDSSIVQPQTTC
jgi:hypothetical protein